MKRGIGFLFMITFIAISAIGQSDSLATYTNPVKHKVVELGTPVFGSKPKNIILFIGDGVGAAQLYAAMTANGGKLNMNHMENIGFLDTQSANRYVTDSGAAGTAIATGQRVDNGFIAMDSNNQPIPTILQIGIKNGLAGGLVSTSGITHATPASFIAHQPSRNLYEAIAADFLKTDIDVFIGGGREHFVDREDGRNIVSELESKGYKIFNSLEESCGHDSGPMGIFTSHGHNPIFETRGDVLKDATNKAINVLKQNENGFFVMIEGSQIDWGGHANSTPYIVGEMLDMDIAIGEALKFAAQDGETLVIVASDHETGGMTITGGDFEKQTVTARYTTGGHTAVIVPVLAYGPGAREFIGFYDNTDLFHKMHKLLELK